MTNELPHVTVATVVQNDGKFLLVEELSYGKNVFNQPAGHLENSEDLIEAAIRETLEETQWHVEITGYLGVSIYQSPNTVSYVRHTFVGAALSFDKNTTRDADILATHWQSYDEIIKNKEALRSPLVLNDIERFVAGKIFTLDSVSGIIA